jgi:hypothetical protein
MLQFLKQAHLLEPPRQQPLMRVPKEIIIPPCSWPLPAARSRPCSERRPNIEHLAGVESSSRLRAYRPSPGIAFRPRSLLGLLCKLVQPTLLFLSSHSWPCSPRTTASQRAPCRWQSTGRLLISFLLKASVHRTLFIDAHQTRIGSRSRARPRSSSCTLPTNVRSLSMVRRPRAIKCHPET